MLCIEAVLDEFDDRNDQLSGAVPAEIIIDALLNLRLNLPVDFTGIGGKQDNRNIRAVFLALGAKSNTLISPTLYIVSIKSYRSPPARS